MGHSHPDTDKHAATDDNGLPLVHPQQNPRPVRGVRAADPRRDEEAAARLVVGPVKEGLHLRMLLFFFGFDVYVVYIQSVGGWW